MKVQLTEGLDDLKEDIVLIRQEIVKLGRVINPLTAITDLSVNMQRTNDKSGQMSQGELSNILDMTEEA